jgi:hypothetical protein
MHFLKINVFSRVGKIKKQKNKNVSKKIVFFYIFNIFWKKVKKPFFK